MNFRLGNHTVHFAFELLIAMIWNAELLFHTIVWVFWVTYALHIWHRNMSHCCCQSWLWNLHMVHVYVWASSISVNIDYVFYPRLQIKNNNMVTKQYKTKCKNCFFYILKRRKITNGFFRQIKINNYQYNRNTFASIKVAEMYASQ